MKSLACSCLGETSVNGGPGDLYQPFTSAGRAGRGAAHLLISVSLQLLPHLGERATAELFLHLLGGIGSVSVYKLYVMSYICKKNSGPYTTAQRHEDKDAMKAMSSYVLLSIHFHC